MLSTGRPLRLAAAQQQRAGLPAPLKPRARRCVAVAAGPSGGKGPDEAKSKK